jgi:membrane protein required for colicin V production
MNWLDIVLALILAASTVSGVVKGLARTVVGISATVLAFLLAVWFYGIAGELFAEYVSSKAVSNFLGFLLIFGLVILGGALLGRLLQALFKWAGLSWLDRLTGGCFGVARGLLIAVVIVMVLMAFSANPPPKSVSGSALAPYVIDAARLASRVARRELSDGFQASYEKIRQTWTRTLEKGIERPQKRDH